MGDRKRTNEEIDAINSSLILAEGDSPLPYATDENTSIDLTDEQKQLEADKVKAEADAAQKIIDDAAEKEKNNPTYDKEKTTPPIIAELDDEQVLAYLKNKKGKEVSSLDEFLNPKKELTSEEIKAQTDQRGANKIAYGLSQKLFTEKELKSFIIDTENPKDLVLASYIADQKAKDDTLTDDEIEEEFNEKFGIKEKEDSRQYKAGQNLINNIANNLIQQKHSKILNLENTYSSYETSQAAQKETENKILSQAPIYKKDVEQVRSEIKKVSFQIGKDEVFETELDDEVVNEVISELLDNTYSQQKIAGGWNKDILKQSAQTAGIIKQLPKLFASYADKKNLERQMGVRGVPPNGKQGGKEVDKAELNERQKAAISHYGLETIAN